MLSVVVITKNEERLIKTCLESVKWADEIVVADNGSTDKTLEIVKKYTDKIIRFDGQDFAALRNKAMEKTSGDWVFFVDADERVLDSLKQEILHTIEQTDLSAFAVNRQNIIFGQLVNYGPYKNDWMIRLLKKSDFKTWVGKVHEYAQFDGDLGYLENKLLHLTHRDLDHFVLKSLDWSNIDANLRLDVHHPKMTKWRFIRILITETYNQGIKRKGFFGGTVGIIDSMLQVFFLYMSYVRLWQLQQKPSIDERYNEVDKKLQDSNFSKY